MLKPAAMHWPVKIEIVVPWRDLDGAGHLNNAVMFSYFEQARVEAYFRVKGIDPSAVDKLPLRDFDIILASTKCDFRSQVQMGERLRVSTWPTRVGSTSFTLRYRVEDVATGRLVAEGESVQVCFDYEAQVKKPIIGSVRAALEAGLPRG